MPFFRKKTYCFTVLAIWPKPPVHDFCLITQTDRTGDALTWHAEHLGQISSASSPCSSTARHAGHPARTQQEQIRGKLERLCWGE